MTINCLKNQVAFFFRLAKMRRDVEEEQKQETAHFDRMNRAFDSNACFLSSHHGFSGTVRSVYIFPGEVFNLPSVNRSRVVVQTSCMRGLPHCDAPV